MQLGVISVDLNAGVYILPRPCFFSPYRDLLADFFPLHFLKVFYTAYVKDIVSPGYLYYTIRMCVYEGLYISFTMARSSS